MYDRAMDLADVALRKYLNDSEDNFEGNVSCTCLTCAACIRLYVYVYTSALLKIQ